MDKVSCRVSRGVLHEPRNRRQSSCGGVKVKCHFLSLPFPTSYGPRTCRLDKIPTYYLIPRGRLDRCALPNQGVSGYGSIKVARAVHDSTECSATYGDKADSRSCLTPVCKKTTSGRPVGAKDLVKTMRRRKSKYLSQTRSNWEPLLVAVWACDDVTSVAHT